jgi:hypothetical protein
MDMGTENGRVVLSLPSNGFALAKAKVAANEAMLVILMINIKKRYYVLEMGNDLEGRVQENERKSQVERQQRLGGLKACTGCSTMFISVL